MLKARRSKLIASAQQNAPSSPLQRQIRHEPSRKMIGLRKDLIEVLATYA